jgi:signal transduction histidine kinase
LIEDAAGSPHWHLPETPEESLSWMGAPLVAGSKAIGVLAVCNCEGERYTQMDLEVLEMFAQHAATAFANSLHYEQAHAHAADDERNRIARELHDSVTQGLFSASLIADVLPELAGQDPVKVREGLTTLRRLTRGALAEMRALLLELRPADLQSVRLNVAIGHLATMATLQGTLTVETDLERIPLLPGKVQVSLYRIAQEALNNIMKHAQARHVRVALRAEPPVDEGRQTTYDGSIHSDQGKQAMDDRRRTADGGGDRGDVIWRGKIILEINDDGVGFEPERVEEGHMGLSIMRERAREVKAHLRITSAPGKGSKVMATWEDGGTRSQGRESGWQLAVGN